MHYPQTNAVTHYPQTNVQVTRPKCRRHKGRSIFIFQLIFENISFCVGFNLGRTNWTLKGHCSSSLDHWVQLPVAFFSCWTIKSQMCSQCCSNCLSWKHLPSFSHKHWFASELFPSLKFPPLAFVENSADILFQVVWKSWLFNFLSGQL